ncbi:MAG: acyl-CoA thioesterase [Lachnospiraceae bacterium]|nr:acyl-CoA thioesterase [Lachnospiraceae bacterium]
MENYIHKVQYYETDKMGITHHSNYVRWMEEARIDYLEKIGFGYRKMEEDGIISPVVGIECEYKSPTTFGDEIEIAVTVEEFKGIRLVLGYTMIRVSDRKTVLEGKSKHCFVNESGKPIALKKSFPELDGRLKELAGCMP